MRLGYTATIHYTQVLDLKKKTVHFQDPLGSCTPSVLPKSLISLITSRLKSTMTEWKSIEQPHALPLQKMDTTVEHLSVWHVVYAPVKGMHLQ